MAMQFKCFATTVMGLEEYAARECEELIGVEVKPDIGKIIFEADREQLTKLNLASRMLHKIFIMLARINVETLDDIYRCARNIDYSEFIEPDQSFAVKAERHSKNYPFTSLDIASTVGRAIIESFRESKGKRLKVDLDQPDIEFYCLLRDSEFFMGLNTTGKSLHHRFYRVYHHRAALHPTIAIGMLRIAGWNPSMSLLDPMCGGGTIPIEAGLMGMDVPLGSRRGELKISNLRFIEKELIEKLSRELEGSIKSELKLSILGTDASPKSIEGARKNAERAGLIDKLEFSIADIFKIGEWLQHTPDHVIFNPPYGIRMGIRDIKGFYRRICKSLAQASPNSTLTVIVSKPALFSRSLAEAGYEVKQRVEVMYGRIRATIISAAR
ncbi:MAG: hypothetical protein DRN68_01390 [Thaumarchaeota archaeon]|nr:MAG: hypothetical protein DRN68_01390 [Nitrososphaerota archaeon]